MLIHQFRQNISAAMLLNRFARNIVVLFVVLASSFSLYMNFLNGTGNVPVFTPVYLLKSST